MTDFEILGVKETATKEEIRQAYHAAVKRLHPDVNDAPNAAAMFRLVQEAYLRVENGTPRRDEPPMQAARSSAETSQEEKLKKVRDLAAELSRMNRNRPPLTRKQKIKRWLLGALRFVLMLPVLLIVNLLFVAFTLAAMIGSAVMLGIACFMALGAVAAIYSQSSSIRMRVVLTIPTTPALPPTRTAIP